MMIAILLAGGVICQLVVLFFSLKLMSITKQRLAWGLIAAAFLLMSVKRAVLLSYLLTGQSRVPLNTINEITNFIIAVLIMIGIVKIFPFLSSVKNAQQDLLMGEEKFRTLAEFTYDWEYWGVPNGRFIYMSPSCERITGYRASEFKNNPELLKSIIHPEDRPIVVGRHESLCPEDLAVHALDFRIITRSGQVRWIAHVCQAVVDNNGRLLGRRVSNRDITERKQSEVELKKAYEELKATQSELIQSAKMATIGQLSGSIIHELKNPMVGILNNTQLVKMMAEKKQQLDMEDFKQILLNIEESTLRCNDVIQSLLGLVRVSKGVFQDIKLNELVERVMVIISKEIKMGNIVIDLELYPGLAGIKGDSQLLQEIILVLMTNAQWAVEKRWEKKEGGRITIKTYIQADNKRVNLAVCDNGIGIPEADIPKLFEPFFTTKKEGEGTGLGLSLVNNIIQKHEGKILVKSKVNEGATFEISFPAA